MRRWRPPQALGSPRGRNPSGYAGLGLAKRLAALLAVLLVSLAPAQAQVVPPAAEPETIQKRLEPPPRPKAVPPIDIPDTGRAIPPPGAEETRFVLTDLLVGGNTVYTEEELMPLWEGLLGQEITLTQFYGVAAAITVRYRNDGYILTRALVPPQEIIDGVAEIEVIEGYIDSVVIEGDPTGPAAQIEDKIAAITDSQPLRADVLERYLLLLNDLPSVIVQSVLRPSPMTPGASELIIILEEAKKSAAISLDNRGSRFLGPYQYGVNVRIDNGFGLYESTELNVIGATELNELLFVSVTHTQPLTSEGTTLTVIASHTSTEPGSNLEVFDVEGDSNAVSVSVVHPVIRTRSENLSVAGGFNYRNATTTILGVTDSEDRVRSVFVGGTYDFIDRFRGISLIGVELRQGLDILGATESGSANLSRTGGRSDFTKITAVARRKQSLAPGWSVSAALKGQYSFSQLLATEECGLGGEDFGSAYVAYELSGDHCLAGRLELQYGAASENEFIESYEIYGFYDLGAVWHIEGSSRESLASAGLGARANLIEDIWGSIEFAMPLTRAPTVERDDGEKNPRIFFSLTKRF